MMGNIHLLLANYQGTDALPHPAADAASVHNILVIVFSVTGAIALLIITLAGFKYVTSQGDPQAVAKSKNTILYAAVGLVISISAASIVGFVLDKL